MPDAVFKDLCIDVSDLTVALPFYAELLGLDDDWSRNRLEGGEPEQTVWLNEVPEPESVKNRVHLDVQVAGVAQVRALGATEVEVLPRWTVLADPEGQEFCAFLSGEVPAYRLLELAVDAVEPERIARWWADRFETTAQHVDDDPWWTVAGGASRLPWEVVFNAVPEPKTTKNRVHWDVWGDAPTLVAAGATWVRRQDQAIEWDVLADPEGNEFCVFVPGT